MLTLYNIYIIIYVEIKKGSYRVTQREIKMKTKEEIIKDVEELISENSLPKNRSVEIVAYGDEDVKVDFVEIGFGGLQEDSIFWEQLDECFDAEEFVDEIYNTI